MNDLAATSGLYSARPRLYLDGVEESGLASAIQGMVVRESQEGLYRCEVTLANWGNVGAGLGYLYFDRQTLDFGKKLEIHIGDGEAEGRVFSGRVMALEAHYPQGSIPRLLVMAEDRLQDLRMIRRTRSWEQVDDRQVIADIASDHGLRSDIDIDGPRYEVLAQVNQSDLAFARERARAVDAHVWVEDDTLHAKSYSRRQSGELMLTYGQRLRQFSVSADLAGQFTRLVVSGWDVAGKQGVMARADDLVLGSEIGAGQLSGVTALRRAFGERQQQVVHQSPANTEQAQALADAHMKRVARSFVRGSGVAEGDARIRVGAKLELDGLGEPFNGIYDVSEVRHQFNAEDGYETYFCVERAGMGQ